MLHGSDRNVAAALQQTLAVSPNIAGISTWHCLSLFLTWQCPPLTGPLSQQPLPCPPSSLAICTLHLPHCLSPRLMHLASPAPSLACPCQHPHLSPSHPHHLSLSLSSALSLATITISLPMHLPLPHIHLWSQPSMPPPTISVSPLPHAHVSAYPAKFSASTLPCTLPVPTSALISASLPCTPSLPAVCIFHLPHCLSPRLLHLSCTQPCLVLATHDMSQPIHLCLSLVPTSWSQHHFTSNFNVECRWWWWLYVHLCNTA